MINAALYKRELKGCVKLLIIFCAIITLYVSIIITLDCHHGPGHLLRRLWGDFQQHSGRVCAVRGVADEIPRHQPPAVPFQENGVPWGLHAASLPVGVPDWSSILVCDSALCHYVCRRVVVGRHQHTNENHPPAFCRACSPGQGAGHIYGHFLCADSAVTCPCRRPIRNMACICSAAGQWRDAHDGSCGFVGCRASGWE